MIICVPIERNKCILHIIAAACPMLAHRNRNPQLLSHSHSVSRTASIQFNYHPQRNYITVAMTTTKSSKTEADVGAEWKFLDEIYSLLNENGVLNTEQSEPVVRFRHPDELMGLIDFKIPDATTMSADLNEIRSICRQVIKYSVKTGHPHFHNQLFGGVDPFGLAGSWITEALNTSQYTYEVGPVFTLMENQLIQTFCKLFGYQCGDGIFAPGGSISNMYGMVLARMRILPDVKSSGLFNSKPLIAYTSEESHYSCKKAVHWLGIGTDNLTIIKTDARGRMLPSDLEAQILETLRAHKQPFFVNATAGTTVQGSFDPLPAIADICERYSVWLHVDACLGGSAIVSEQHGRRLLAGVERSDSLAWNPHKSLGVPLQCSMLLVRQKGILHECNSTQAQYLFQQDKFYDVSYDTGDKSVQCGRKVDVFKFWLMLKARGLRGMAERMDGSMAMAAYLTTSIERRVGFRLVPGGEFDFTNLCFWYVPKRMRCAVGEEDADWWTELFKVAPAIKERMCLEGTIMVGYSPLPHRGMGNFLRMVLACLPVAGQKDVDFVLDEIERMGEQV